MQDIHSAFLAKYKALLEQSKCPASFIFINQMRNRLNFRGNTTLKQLVVMHRSFIWTYV